LIDDANGGVWVVFEESFWVIGEAGDGGEGVGEFCFRENDGGGAWGGETEAAAVINEVRVLFPVGNDVLVEVARGGNGAIL